MNQIESWVDDEDWEDECDEDDDEWGCVFGAECLMSSEHFAYECYTREMAEEWASDARR